MSERYKAVDFPAVLEQFAARAYSPKTARKIRSAGPKQDLHEVRRDLALAQEAIGFLQNGQEVSLGGFGEIDKAVQAAEKGQTLLPNELLEISFFLAACQAAHQAFDPEKQPLLSEIASTISVLKPLASRIDACVDLSGQIRNDATPALVRLDHSLIQARADLAATARRFIKAHGSSLMDSVSVSSGSRTCVLVKAADKYKFGGMVHALSQSGAACYLEPDVLVPLNNKVAELQMDIEEEKKRICRELSGLVRQNASALLSNDESLEILDLALAKASWSLAHDGSVPVLQTGSHAIRLEHAVHPLLDAKKAVANNYHLPADKACLMITGSNMGGKTVTLKTIGLFALLAQSGFPVSAHFASLPVYNQFFFDIGDEQSIENNLSTFSAHAKKLGRITNKADDKTFVLLDEIGNGTDPAEGAALAQAVLEELIARGTTILTSTHYSQVKTFGKTSPDVLVGSVEFDPKTLRPTYRFLEGVSGASYAFYIAGQFGLSHALLERAEAIKKENATENARQLEILEKQQADVQKQKDRFDKLVANAHDLQRKAEHDKTKYEEMKQRLDSEYEQKLEDMLFEKKEEARKIIRDLKKSTSRLSHEQIEQMGKLNTLYPDEQSEKPASEEKHEFKAGDYVRIAALNNHGEIQQIKKNKAVVLVNGRKVNISVDQLTPMKKPKSEGPVRSKRPERSFKAFPMELNLIGMHVEEAISTLDHYLDQAVYHRVKNVRIIHGMGTGALRNAVWQDLKKHPQVKGVAAGGPGEGGLGATLVELK